MNIKHIAIAAFALLLGMGVPTSRADILYVGEGNNAGGHIDKYTSSGARLPFGAVGSPTGLAFDAAGSLYAADLPTNSIYKFTPGGVRWTFASTGMNQPSGIAFDGAGNLYVSNYPTQNILKFTIGGVRTVFAPALLGHPLDLAFDAAGNLYAASTPYNDPDGGGIIEKFTPGGAGSVFASGLDGIRGLAFDSAGNLFVSNGNYYGSADSTVLKFTIGGEKSVFANFGTSFPQGLAFDSGGNLYVANYGNETGSKKITKFTPEGVASTFVTLSNADLPRYLAFTDDAGRRLQVPPVPEPSAALVNPRRSEANGIAKFHFDLLGKAGRTYQLQSSPALNTWTNLDRVTLSAPSLPIELTIPPGQPQQFYRAIAQ